MKFFKTKNLVNFTKLISFMISFVLVYVINIQVQNNKNQNIKININVNKLSKFVFSEQDNKNIQIESTNEKPIWKKISELPYTTNVEISSTGLLISEFDDRTQINPYNGIYLTKDMGNLWEEFGLKNRAVTKLKMVNNDLYASTFYENNSQKGLFVLEEMSGLWKYIGPNVSIKNFDLFINENNQRYILVGTDNLGLYVSKDNGISWENSFSSQNIRSTACFNKVCFISTNTNVYESSDLSLWTNVPSLYNKGINVFGYQYDNERQLSIFLSGSWYDQGLFYSIDGKTWEQINSFLGKRIDGIKISQNKIYVASENKIFNKQAIYVLTYKFDDLNNQNVNFEIEQEIILENSNLYKIKDIEIIPTPIPTLVFNSNYYGIFMGQVGDLNKYPIFRIPWEYQNTTELVENITSFFDHTYPLLGYSFYKEPNDENTSTLNFLGKKDTIPNIYYSSHSGIDFGLKYNSNIISSMPGIASYYYCKDCGHSIKVDHQNGYQTTYMHLRESELITKDKPIQIYEDTVIGKVGMTGKTSGPHLHFEVLRDINNNQNFIDDFPNGRIDPFGWKPKYKDPWEDFSWEDILGRHKGTQSKYLWKHSDTTNNNSLENDFEKTSFFIKDQEITLDNISISLNETIPAFVKINKYIKPSNSDNLYIPGSSTLINVFDYFGNEIKELNQNINIKIFFDPEYTSGIIPNSLYIYYWDENNKMWIKLPTIIDLIENYAQTNINHLTWFALMGEKINIEKPITNINIQGEKDINNDYYIKYPVVSLTTSNCQNCLSFYALNNTEEWFEYSQPFEIMQEGYVSISYRSMDLENQSNIEETNKTIIKINTKSYSTDMGKILNTKFTIN